MAEKVTGGTGLPKLEGIRTEIFDTRELSPSGESLIEFFFNPNPDPHLSNMSGSGQLIYPQQLTIFGVVLRVYQKPVKNHVDEKAIKSLVSFLELRQMLFANANIRFIIGSKSYLDIPVNSVLQELASGELEEISAFSVPIKDEKGNIVESWKRAIPLDGENPPDRFYDVTIPVNDKIKPLHIPPQQSFKTKIDWKEPISYAPDLLGKVFVRTGLSGILWREVQ